MWRSQRPSVGSLEHFVISKKIIKRRKKSKEFRGGTEREGDNRGRK